MLRFIHKISSTRKNCHFILYSSHLNKIQILLFNENELKPFIVTSQTVITAPNRLVWKWQTFINR